MAQISVFLKKKMSQDSKCPDIVYFSSSSFYSHAISDSKQTHRF